MEAHNRKKKKKVQEERGLMYEILDFVKITLICFLVVLFCVKFIAKPVSIDGDSMYPTLKNGDYGFSSIVSTYKKDIKRFDVVVAEYEPTDKLWVKRVIGLPGETVEFKNDQLYINGKKVEQPFLDKKYISKVTDGGLQKFTNDFGPYKVKKGEYFLCGDNRLVSKDSREVGAFKLEDIKCKYVYVLFPFSDIRSVTNAK